ncbi:hypothetical protein AAFP30_16065 [Gordonia sp. CPCC 205515]|uniref:hypothetical protein n=1 Tax=Gordonia sp. CPCC 205515 TaxID=3140791 RepID=UPI003AF3F06D
MLPILALTFFYAYNVYSSVKPVYYSQTLIGIAPPTTRVDAALPGQAVPRNGLLDIGGAPFVANMAALSLGQPTVANKVVAGGGNAAFSARMFPVPEATQQIPLVLIDTSTPDPQTSLRTLQLATAEYGVALENLQRDARVSPSTMVQPFVVSAPSTPAPAMPSRTRSTMTIVVAGLGISIVAAVVADVILMRRRQRRTARAAVAETSSDAAPSEPESALATQNEAVGEVPADSDEVAVVGSRSSVRGVEGEQPK